MRFQRLLFTAFALATFPQAARAQTVQLEPGSSLRLAGTSTLHDWSCAVTTIEARVTSRTAVAGDSALLRGQIEVPVAELECGDGRMESQMRQALRADEHPMIRYELVGYSVRQEAAGTRVETDGRIHVAGREQPVRMSVLAQNVDGILRAYGKAPIRMTQFGIKPPTAFFGLLKAGDEVVVHVDLRIHTESARAIAGN